MQPCTPNIVHMEQDYVSLSRALHPKTSGKPSAASSTSVAHLPGADSAVLGRNGSSGPTGDLASRRCKKESPGQAAYSLFSRGALLSERTVALSSTIM